MRHDRMRVTRYAGAFAAPARCRHKNLFGGGAPAPTPAAPTVTPPPPMPDPNDPAALEARRRAAADTARAGRSSTILTTAANRMPLAAGGFGGKTLG